MFLKILAWLALVFVQLTRASNFISYAEVRPRLVTFPSGASNSSSNSIRDFKETLYDSTRNEVLIGARDYLVRLNADTWTYFESELTDLVGVGPSEEALHECRRSHALTQRHECHNFIKVIVSDGDANDEQLLICGTNARRPQCQWRSRRSPSLLIESFDGMGKSPHLPSLSSAYTRVKETGDFLFATSIDYNSDMMGGSGDWASGGGNSMLKLDYLIDRSLGMIFFSIISSLQDIQRQNMLK